jgi:hypothetical protein
MLHPAILTIENYASFNRQVREIEDGSLVVYTGWLGDAHLIDCARRRRRHRVAPALRRSPEHVVRGPDMPLNSFTADAL